MLRLLAASLLLGRAEVAGDDMGLLHARLFAKYLGAACNSPTTCDSAHNAMETQSPDGSWATVDYTTRRQDAWPAIAHWSRVCELARAAQCPACQGRSPGFPTQHALAERARLGIDFWLRRDPRDNGTQGNWWWDVIAVPQSVSQAFILLLNTSVLGPAELAGGDAILARADWTQQTGENQVWCLRTGGINRGVLSRNGSLVSAAFAAAWSQLQVQPLATSTHCLSPACANADCCDGLQKDLSFHQHGPLLQSAAYGAGFMQDLLDFVALAAQTRWAVAQEPLSLLADFLIKGQSLMMRTGAGVLNATWHIPPLDREIGRPPGGPTALDAPALAQQVETSMLRSPLSADRVAALKRWTAQLRGESPPLPATRHFVNSDYTVHQRPRFTMDLRMYSRRTFNSECGNTRINVGGILPRV